MDFNVIISNLPYLFSGLKITWILSVNSLIFSLLLGIILGCIRYFNIPVLSSFATIFIELTRCVPLILYIVFIHYTLSPIIYNHYNYLKFLGLDSLEIQTGVISLILFTSAYIAEIIRSSLGTINKQQIWDAKSLGFTTLQTLRYIIFPIVLIKSLPSLISQFASLIKDTSLVSVIGLIELTRASEIISEITQMDLQIMSITMVLYFIICYSLTLLCGYLNKKYSAIIKK